jgi:hypothetical protein
MTNSSNSGTLATGTHPWTVDCPATHPNAVGGGMGSTTPGITLSDSYPSDPGGNTSTSPTAWTADGNIPASGGDFTVYVICTT